MNKIICGDAYKELQQMPSESVDCCITSPPYWGLRDYGISGQLGLEKTPEEYVAKIVDVFREVKRVLKKDGTLWLNLGDSYVASQDGRKDKSLFWDGRKRNNLRECNNAKSIVDNTKIGLLPKNLVGIPWRVAFALQADGWYLRQDIIWHKPNPMPESVTDRCTKAHEYIFLLAKSQKYYFDNEAIKENSATNENRPYGIIREREYDYDSKQKAMGRYAKQSPKMAAQDVLGNPMYRGGHHNDGLPAPVGVRNKRSVWTVTTKPFKGAHFATFPEDLITPCVLAGCPKGGVVLDPFSGAGTTCVVAKKLGRQYLGIELNLKYIEMSEKRLNNVIPDMFLSTPATEEER